MAHTKSTSKKIAKAEIVLTPVPLEHDAYLVKGELSHDEVLSLKLAWSRMNKELPKAKLLVVVQMGTRVERMPSEVIEKWIARFQDVLKERGANAIR